MIPDNAPGTIPIHLLRLVSPSQPVGAFAYSRALEWVVQTGVIRDEATAAAWILGIVEHSYAALDGALFWRMVHSLANNDRPGFLKADAWLAATRESREIELEDRQMGESLLRLLRDLDVPAAHALADRRVTYPAAFALAAVHWNIAPADALRGLIWSVIESQVAAAIRLVPLGHTAGQRILILSAPAIERAAQKAMSLGDDEIGNSAPAMAMASAHHETQYSRLFRS